MIDLKPRAPNLITMHTNSVSKNKIKFNIDDRWTKEMTCPTSFVGEED
jgi:hypothetical protein